MGEIVHAVSWPCRVGDSSAVVTARVRADGTWERIAARAGKWTTEELCCQVVDAVNALDGRVLCETATQAALLQNETGIDAVVLTAGTRSLPDVRAVEDALGLVEFSATAENRWGM